jgi:hypothetical protein
MADENIVVHVTHEATGKIGGMGLKWRLIVAFNFLDRTR